MRNGNKILAKKMVTMALERVKRIQLQRYHKSTDEDKEKIELDPFAIFHLALANCIPILHLEPCKKGGIQYQVTHDNICYIQIKEKFCNLTTKQPFRYLYRLKLQKHSI